MATTVIDMSKCGGCGVWVEAETLEPASGECEICVAPMDAGLVADGYETGVRPCEDPDCGTDCAVCGAPNPEDHPVSWDRFGFGTGYCGTTCYETAEMKF